MKLPSSKMILFFFFLLVAVTWTVDSVVSQLKFRQLTPSQKLQVLWIQDAQKLEQSNAVPLGWYKLREIEYSGGDKGALGWISDGIQAPHPITIEGTHKLEVLLLSFEDEGKSGAIIQYNLVEIKSQNMEWELGRTFYLSGTRGEWAEWLEQRTDQIKATFTKAFPPSEIPKPTEKEPTNSGIQSNSQIQKPKPQPQAPVKK